MFGEDRVFGVLSDVGDEGRLAPLGRRDPSFILLPSALHGKTRNAKARIRLNGQSSIRNRLATAPAPSIVLGLHQSQSVLDPLDLTITLVLTCMARSCPKSLEA